MNASLHRLLDEIRAELAEFDEPMDPPASAEQLAALQAACTSQLSYVPPDGYLELLATHDGVDCNGVQLYASVPKVADDGSARPEYLKRGFVEANLIWREYEPNKHYAFFAESGDKLYAHNLTSNKFEIVDRLTKALIYEPSSCNTFDELLKQVFNHMLDRYGADEDDEA